MRRGARRFLATCSSPERVRAAMQTRAGYDIEVWRRIAGELGWPALAIPEEYGGAGLTYVELVGILEEMGRALLCSPFFASVCLAANALLAAGTAPQKREHLPRIASGEITATVAFAEANGASGSWDASAIEAAAKPGPRGFTIDGAKTFVLDGHTADLLIVAARAPGSSGVEGVSLFVVPASAAGITRRALTTMDATRKQAEIVLRDVSVPASALLGEPGRGWASLERTLDLACIALAAEQLGGAQRCLEMAVAYAKERVQFGRPIGSFQAIKHKCADMLVDVESARSASYYAGWAAASAESEIPLAAPLAKAYCSDAYFRCAAENIQVHGGVGFTWEHDAHLYFKRARSSEALFGLPSYHRERLARRIGL